MKKLMILLIIQMALLMSCQSCPENTITNYVIPVPQTVQPTLKNETFTDGVFYSTDDHMKLMLYINDLQEETELLRAELSKFE